MLFHSIHCHSLCWWCSLKQKAFNVLRKAHLFFFLKEYHLLVFSQHISNSPDLGPKSRTQPRFPICVAKKSEPWPLLPRVSTNKKLDSEVELDLKPRHSDTGTRYCNLQVPKGFSFLYSLMYLFCCVICTFGATTSKKSLPNPMPMYVASLPRFY